MKGWSNRHTLKLIGLGFCIGVIVMIISTVTYAYAEEPTFCGGCHSMEESYKSWQASSHSAVACTECHLPNDKMLSKFTAKAATGLWDTYKETRRDYTPQQIQVSEKGRAYLKGNCSRCHEPTIRNTSLVSEGKDCISCHRNLVHKK